MGGAQPLVIIEAGEDPVVIEKAPPEVMKSAIDFEESDEFKRANGTDDAGVLLNRSTHDMVNDEGNVNPPE